MDLAIILENFCFSNYDLYRYIYPYNFTLTGIMKKQEKASSLSSGSSLNAVFLEESPLIQWLSNKGYQLLWIFLGIFALFVLIAYFFSGRERDSEGAYLKADKEFIQFATPSISAEESQQSLLKLQTILDKYPELHAKYDGLIAQTLITKKQGQEALGFAKRALTRTRTEIDPFYSLFAENTLLISEGKEEEALNQSKSLQKSLESTGNNEKTLHIFNLLRIGMLQEKLHLQSEEKKTLAQLKELISKEDSALLLTPFQEGNVTLMDYINAREVALKDIKL